MLPKLFSWPIKPYIQNQAWGVLDPKDYSQFGFTRHNGIDMRLSPDRTIYAPFDYTVVRVGTRENGQWQPNGGGIFVGILSEPIDFPAFTNTTPNGVVVQFAAGTYRVLLDMLHLDHVLVKEGATGHTGDLVAICDNTGFSTGPHCHTQWRRVNWDGKTATTVDVNDANNSFDPTPFWDGFYSVDVPKSSVIYKSLITALTSLRDLFLGRS
jgi:murein DD-endopeptidase MepM/ murein hydrolase activator NlpD